MPTITIIITVLLGVLILMLPRHLAIIPMIIGACIIPIGSALLVGPLHLPTIRILILFAMIRIIKRKEITDFQINGLDKMMIIFVVAMVVTGLLKERRDLTFLFRLGFLCDTLGFYFSFRCWTQNKKAITSLTAGLALILMIVAMEMIYEKFTGYNLFSHLGGLPPYPSIRGGAIRAQGVFTHAILAGTIGATSIGMFLGIFWQGKKWWKFGVIGIISGIVMLITCASSGPILTVMALFVAMAAWPYRNNLKAIRWGILFTLIGLEVFMKAHVWYVLARIDLTGSSTGWHRGELINSAIVFLKEWWLLGTDYTRHWMPTGVTWSLLHADLTNHYIKMGVLGGLPTMIAFILIIVKGYQIIGSVLHRLPEGNFNDKILAWSYGAVLFSHTATFFGVNYFDQSKMFFFLHMGIIASLPTVMNLPSLKKIVKEQNFGLSVGFQESGQNAGKST